MTTRGSLSPGYAVVNACVKCGSKIVSLWTDACPIDKFKSKMDEDKDVPTPLNAEQLKFFFDRAVVITLDWTPQRLEEFQKHLAQTPWPLRDVEVHKGVDGLKASPPDWWREGGPAWGCFQSHLGVLRKALHDGVERLLIMEDDCGFAVDLAPRLAKFLASVPTGWHCSMLGGQQMGTATASKYRPEYSGCPNVSARTVTL